MASSVPFLLFDLVIIALVLPVAIESFNLVRTRRLRGHALGRFHHAVADRLALIVRGPRQDEGDRGAPSAIAPFRDHLLEQHRDLLARITPVLTMLDADSARLVWEVQQHFEDLVRQTSARIAGGRPADGFVTDGRAFLSAMSALSARATRLGGTPAPQGFVETLTAQVLSLSPIAPARVDRRRR